MRDVGHERLRPFVSLAPPHADVLHGGRAAGTGGVRIGR